MRTDLERLFNPRSIAIVGASSALGTISGQPLNILVKRAFPGPLYPVNPKYAELLGRRCYPSVASLPETPDLALVLALYPAMSLLGGWGDFALLYFSGLLGPSLAVGVVHVGALLGFLWLMKQIWMQGFLAYPLPRPWRLPWVVVAPPQPPPPAE